MDKFEKDILWVLRGEGLCSQYRLARLTGFSLSTVRDRLYRLRARGLVVGPVVEEMDVVNVRKMWRLK